VQYLLGDTTIDEAGAARKTAQLELLRASAAAGQMAILAVEDGMSEVEAARRSTIDRKHLRVKYFGK
jgi:hypothetical protein